MSLPDPKTIDFDYLDVTEEADMQDGEYVGTVYGKVTAFGGQGSQKYAVFLAVAKESKVYAIMLDAEERPKSWDVLRVKVQNGNAELVEVVA